MTKTKTPSQTTIDDSVSRDVILALAERCRCSGNTPLRDLLLTVAGMVRADGQVVSSEWRSFCRLDGPFSIGLMLANRYRYGTTWEPACGGMDALDEQVRSQAHGWSYTTIGELGLTVETVEILDGLYVTTVGELVALILGLKGKWCEPRPDLTQEFNAALDRFRETLPPEQQAAFDLTRNPPPKEEKPKRTRKRKEPA